MEAIKAIPPTMNPYANGGTLQIIYIFIGRLSMIKCLKIGGRVMNKYISLKESHLPSVTFKKPHCKQVGW